MSLFACVARAHPFHLSLSLSSSLRLSSRPSLPPCLFFSLSHDFFFLIPNFIDINTRTISATIRIIFSLLLFSFFSFFQSVPSIIFRAFIALAPSHHCRHCLAFSPDYLLHRVLLSLQPPLLLLASAAAAAAVVFILGAFVFDRLHSNSSSPQSIGLPPRLFPFGLASYFKSPFSSAQSIHRSFVQLDTITNTTTIVFCFLSN